MAVIFNTRLVFCFLSSALSVWIGIWEKTFYCDGFKFDIFMFPMSLLPLSVSFSASSLGYPIPLMACCLLRPFLPPSVFIEASTACKCFIPLLFFIIKSVCQTGVVVTYALMVGCFSCFAPRTNGQWTMDTICCMVMKGFVLFVAYFVVAFFFFIAGGVCCLCVCVCSRVFSLFLCNVCMIGMGC